VVELWFHEKETNELYIAHRISRQLFHGQSPYQQVSILEGKEFGRMLVLDGIIQTTLRDEYIYHEMLAHVALFTHRRPEKVLVIGGGDGGTVREVLKHPSVEQIHLVEIDEMVIDACRQHLPELASSFDDPRVSIHCTDGLKFVQDREGYYDVIIVDSSDPLGPAEGLFAYPFYKDCHRALKDDGVFVAQTESPFFTPELVGRIFGSLAALYRHTYLFLASVPTYSVAPWSFTIGSKAAHPLEPRGCPPEDWQLRYYTEEIHRAAFALPAEVKKVLTIEDK
jgi:spermidine synthase